VRVFVVCVTNGAVRRGGFSAAWLAAAACALPGRAGWDTQARACALLWLRMQGWCVRLAVAGDGETLGKEMKP